MKEFIIQGNVCLSVCRILLFLSVPLAMADVRKDLEESFLQGKDWGIEDIQFNKPMDCSISNGEKFMASYLIFFKSGNTIFNLGSADIDAFEVREGRIVGKVFSTNPSHWYLPKRLDENTHLIKVVDSHRSKEVLPNGSPVKIGPGSKIVEYLKCKYRE